MSRFRRTVGLAATVAVLLSVVSPAASASAQARAVSYVPPLDAPVVDGFRPPGSQFAAGNRGIDYAAEAGDPVRAAAGGQVVFAGRIGPDFHVVVLHADGVRTSYSFLQAATVRRGDRVAQGDVVGTAGGQVHFGARAGSAYLDPTDLFAGEGPAIRLVPVERLPSEAEEEGFLRKMIESMARGSVAAARWAGDQAAQAAEAAADVMSERLRRATHYLRTLFPPLAAIDLAAELNAAVNEWHSTRDDCTAPDVNPTVPAERRIAVLIGGLGSSSAGLRRGRGIAGVDPAGLGFASRDTYYFSYQGGHVGERGYGPEDTQNGFEESGAKLSALLSRLRRENPGIPIVLIAHSQGGLVARAALGQGGPGPAAVQDLVTLATPHQGSDVATAIAELRGNALGQVAIDAAGPAAMRIDPGSRSVRELSETSDFIRNLPDVPPGIRLTSIAANGDLVVATPRARVEGADNRIVSPDTVLHDHDALPAHPEAHREIALALAGMAATCKSLTTFVADRLRGHLISLGVDAAGVGLSHVLSRYFPPMPG